MANFIAREYKKDYKRCEKRGLDMEILKAVVATLAIPKPLEPKNKDHDLIFQMPIPKYRKEKASSA